MSKIKERLLIAIESFQNDPPDSDYQQGYLAALEDMYEELINEQI